MNETERLFKLNIEYLLWANTRVEKEYQKIIPICLDGEPWNSSLMGRSINQITTPVKIKTAAAVIHRSPQRCFRKIQMSLLIFGTTTPMPKSVNGCVKSTYANLMMNLKDKIIIRSCH